jgi:hypothetical protein
LYILIFRFFIWDGKTKILDWIIASIPGI